MQQTRRKTASLPRRPVSRATLPNEIYRQIKELILDGGIAPGELVTIQGLADAFDVSTMPVREALQRLTTEKALTVMSGRSVGIPELEASRLRWEERDLPPHAAPLRLHTGTRAAVTYRDGMPRHLRSAPSSSAPAR